MSDAPALKAPPSRATIVLDGQVFQQVWSGWFRSLYNYLNTTGSVAGLQAQITALQARVTALETLSADLFESEAGP